MRLDLMSVTQLYAANIPSGSHPPIRLDIGKSPSTFDQKQFHPLNIEVSVSPQSNFERQILTNT